MDIRLGLYQMRPKSPLPDTTLLLIRLCEIRSPLSIEREVILSANSIGWNNRYHLLAISKHNAGGLA